MKTAKRVRVIHDLSWPPGRSVNDFISATECSLSYVTVDQAANLCLLYSTPWIIKMDLKAAFLSCPVRQADTELLGLQLPDTKGTQRAHMFQALSFGLLTTSLGSDSKGLAIYHDQEGSSILSGSRRQLLHNKHGNQSKTGTKCDDRNSRACRPLSTAGEDTWARKGHRIIRNHDRYCIYVTVYLTRSNAGNGHTTKSIRCTCKTNSFTIKW